MDYNNFLDLMLNTKQRSEMEPPEIAQLATDDPPLYKSVKADFVVTEKKMFEFLLVFASLF